MNLENLISEAKRKYEQALIEGEANRNDRWRNIQAHYDLMNKQEHFGGDVDALEAASEVDELNLTRRSYLHAEEQVELVEQSSVPRRGRADRIKEEEARLHSPELQKPVEEFKNSEEIEVPEEEEEGEQLFFIEDEGYEEMGKQFRSPDEEEEEEEDPSEAEEEEESYEDNGGGENSGEPEYGEDSLNGLSPPEDY